MQLRARRWQGITASLPPPTEEVFVVCGSEPGHLLALLLLSYLSELRLVRCAGLVLTACADGAAVAALLRDVGLDTVPVQTAERLPALIEGLNGRAVVCLSAAAATATATAAAAAKAAGAAELSGFATVADAAGAASLGSGLAGSGLEVRAVECCPVDLPAALAMTLAKTLAATGHPQGVAIGGALGGAPSAAPFALIAAVPKLRRRFFAAGAAAAAGAVTVLGGGSRFAAGGEAARLVETGCLKGLTMNWSNFDFNMDLPESTARLADSAARYAHHDLDAVRAHRPCTVCTPYAHL